MTVGLAIKVPGHGAVLACDSRVLCGHDIATDGCEKWVVAGSAVAVVAGHDGALMDVLHGAKNLEELRNRSLEYTDQKSLNWDLLVYDRKSDTLCLLDNHGTLLRLGLTYAIGCGGGYAQGVLDVLPKASSLPQAARTADKACRVAIKRNAACGGRVRVISVPFGKRQPATVR